MTNLLSIQDLNTTINHEPRIQDILLGKKLGLRRPRNIRATIEANKAELERYNSLAVSNGESRGQEFCEYYLNEPQALLICMFSRTEKAAEVRKAIIEVFMAYRDQQKSPQRPARPFIEQIGSEVMQVYHGFNHLCGAWREIFQAQEDTGSPFARAAGVYWKKEAERMERDIELALRCVCHMPLRAALGGHG